MSRENPLSGRADPWRIVDAGFRDGPIDGFEVHVEKRKTAAPSWQTFLRIHAEAIAAIDMCVVPTVTFERLFAFLVVGHGRRQLLWFEVTQYPTAEWLARQ